MVGCWLEVGTPTAITGSVLPKFDSQPSPWIAAGRFFDRPRPTTGTLRSGAPAGNLLLNLPEVKSLGINFDARLGLRGGEDTLFTRQLTAAGGEIRFCREGVVYDLVANERNTREWVLRRARHHGSTTSVIQLWETRGLNRSLTRTRLVVTGYGRVLIGLSDATLGRISGSLQRNASGWRMVNRGLGIVSGALGRESPEYARSEDSERHSSDTCLYSNLLRGAMNKATDATGSNLGVVVVNYGASDLLRENLQIGLGQAASAQIIVVDNFSSKTEREQVRALSLERGWSLVEPDGNLGFGAGVNIGVLRGAQLGCKTFITLNPDAYAEPQVLAALGQTACRNTHALISPLVVDSEGTTRFRGSTVSMRTGRIRTGWVTPDVDPEWKNWLTGACMAFSGEAFVRLGGFSTAYFLYWEDIDLSRRAANLGMGLLLRHDLQVVHDEGGTHNAANSRAKSGLYYYYNARNRLMFGARMASTGNRINWLLSTPKESILIWLRGGRKQLFTRPGGILALGRGVIEGLWIHKTHKNHDFS